MVVDNAEFNDFELELEFNESAGGNSGVFVRTTRDGNPAYAGLEIQVLDDAAPVCGIEAQQFCGSVYSLVPPAVRVSNPQANGRKCLFAMTTPKFWSS